MPKIIYAIENTWDFTNLIDWALNMSSEFEDFLNLTATVSVTSVKDMVDKVLNAVGSDPLTNLNILGHGRPGSQSVGKGMGSDPTKTKYIALDNSTGSLIGTCEQELSRLIPKLSTDALISLHGCNTGKGQAGEDLLKRMSTVLGVSVEAGIITQRTMPGYEGPVLRCQGNVCVTMPAAFLH